MPELRSLPEGYAYSVLARRRVAEHDIHHQGRNVAKLSVKPSGSQVFLDNLTVDPSHRGRGLGHHLLQQALSSYPGSSFRGLARPHGDDGLDLPGLLAMYAKHGLVPTGEKDPTGTGMYIAKQADAAAGIPDRGEYGDLSKVQAGQLLDYIVQRHRANRAGLHYDVRFGDKDGLHSWAVPKGLPLPGQKHLAVHQPLHSQGYQDFEGEIPTGYGAGHVARHDKGQILVTKAGPDGIHFTTAHRRFPERYALIPYAGREGNKRQWLMLNTTKSEAVPYEKKRYAKVPADQAEAVLGNLAPGSTVQAKLDGAASLTKLFKDHAEVVSYRARKDTGGPIVHTERVAGGRIPLKVPRGLAGTVLRGELYGVNRDGQAIPPQELGGLLNSSIAKSRAAQQDRGIKLRNMLFDVHQVGNKPLTEPAYQKRREQLQQVLQHLPPEYFHGPEEASTPQDALAMWQGIKGGTNPLTREGVVVHPPAGTPQKIKLMDEHDVHIRGFFPGQGKYQGNAIGGFNYSHTPTGPVVGEVGSGFTDETRRMMHTDPDAFLGRVAKVRAQDKLPSGALRAPSFLSLHEDYPMKAAQAAARYFGDSQGCDGDVTEEPDYSLFYVKLARKNRKSPGMSSGPQAPISSTTAERDISGQNSGIELNSVKPDALLKEWGDANASTGQGAEPILSAGVTPEPVPVSAPSSEAVQPDLSPADAVPPPIKSPAVLRRLLEAKAHSDHRRYRLKHGIMKQLLNERPGEFVVDSEAKGITGVTHVPTGFRMHLPRVVVPRTLAALA